MTVASQRTRIKIETQKTGDQRSLVTIIIPTLDEEDGIFKTLSQIPIEEVKKLGFELEVLVVDGGSIDQTREIAKNLGAKVSVECQRGYGRAYKVGFNCAKGDFIIALDGDASYPVCQIPCLLNVFGSNDLEFMSADRFANMEDGAMNPINKFGNKLLSFLVFVLFSIRLSDSQSGMWVFKKDILPDICPSADGMAFSEEIKIRAFRKVRAKEVQALYRRRVGRVKLRVFKDGLMNLLHLFKLRIQLTVQDW